MSTSSLPLLPADLCRNLGQVPHASLSPTSLRASDTGAPAKAVWGCECCLAGAPREQHRSCRCAPGQHNAQALASRFCPHRPRVLHGGSLTALRRKFLKRLGKAVEVASRSAHRWAKLFMRRGKHGSALAWDTEAELKRIHSLETSLALPGTSARRSSIG